MGFGDPLVYERIDLRGEPLGPVVEMPWRSWAIADDPTGGLVTVYNGNIYRVDQDGATQLAAGELVGLSRDIVVARRCDEVLQCRFEIVDRATGETRAVPHDPALGDGVGVEPVSTWGPERSSPMSPDGSAVVVVGSFDSASELGIVDLATGAYAAVSTGGLGGSFVWSPDSRFLFHLENGVITAYDRETGESFAVLEDQLTWTGFTARPPIGGVPDEGATSG